MTPTFGACIKAIGVVGVIAAINIVIALITPGPTSTTHFIAGTALAVATVALAVAIDQGKL